MKKIRIFIADLTHKRNNIMSTPVMPYNIGLIASYAIEKFGDKIEIKLFKYPDKLLTALDSTSCDIFACSTYIWNDSLAHWACRVAKEKNPNVITVLGGPNFTHEKDHQLTYFSNHKEVDVRVLLEGEISFSNVINLVLKHGVNNKEKIFDKQIDGCVYMDRNKNCLIEGETSRIQSLDEIPSPYTTGVLDEFFDGLLTPIIQTSRGCPFKCNFCVESDKYYSKIESFEIERSISELEYIGKKISQTPQVSTLLIADSNYGMYKKDILISEKILHLQKEYNWPKSISVSTGKKFDNVLKTTEMLMHTFIFSLSVQSMDDNVLDAIGRKNMEPEKYKILGEMIRKKGHTTLSETIAPLPKETLSNFINGLVELMDWKVSRVITNTLMLLHGTIYKNNKFLKDFGIQSKYRLLENQFGTYGGEKVFEFEEVGISTNTMNFTDYLETRKFSFFIEMAYNSKTFLEAEYFLEDLSLKYSNFVLFAYQELNKSHKNIQLVLQSYIDESISELKDSEKKAIDYYSNQEVFNLLLTGNEGGNLKYKHKALLLSEHLDIWLDFIFSSLEKFLINNNIQVNEEFGELVLFIKSKFDGVLDQTRTNNRISHKFSFDIISWLSQKDRVNSLKYYNNNGLFIDFYYDKVQRDHRNVLFSKYNNRRDLVLSYSHQQHLIYRKYDKVAKPAA